MIWTKSEHTQHNSTVGVMKKNSSFSTDLLLGLLKAESAETFLSTIIFNQSAITSLWTSSAQCVLFNLLNSYCWPSSVEHAKWTWV